jgi:hypothetical protein
VRDVIERIRNPKSNESWEGWDEWGVMGRRKAKRAGAAGADDEFSIFRWTSPAFTAVFV